MGTNNGLFLSKDKGLNWAMSNDGLPSMNVCALAVGEKATLVGSWGLGIWRKSSP